MSNKQPTNAARLAALRTAAQRAIFRAEAHMAASDGTREERATRAHKLLVEGLRTALLCETEGAETVTVAGVKIPVVGVVGDGGKVEWVQP